MPLKIVKESCQNLVVKKSFSFLSVLLVTLQHFCII